MDARVQGGVAQRWLYSAKPASWPKLFLPCLLGQWLGASAAGRLDAAGLAVGLGFTTLGLLFIVWINDWGDRAIDALKRQMFPDGCSPKTIPDAILSARALLFAGSSVGLGALLFAGLGARALGRPELFWLGVVGMLVFSAYSLPPLRLNYRGGGELLEMLGAGLVLPLFNVLCQGPWPGAAALWPLPGFALLCLASALASGLSDEVSDHDGGKTTFTTWFGNRVVRRSSEWLLGLGVLAWLGAALAAAVLPRWPALVVLGVVGWQARLLLHASPTAVTNAFAAQASYKQHLHRAIAQGTLCIVGWQWLATSGVGR
jgi:1,4-dihydroxy-2-naphthoate octaprenyltransferase